MDSNASTEVSLRNTNTALSDVDRSENQKICVVQEPYKVTVFRRRLSSYRMSGSLSHSVSFQQLLLRHQILCASSRGFGMDPISVITSVLGVIEVTHMVTDLAQSPF
jgi:hypothetical protein